MLPEEYFQKKSKKIPGLLLKYALLLYLVGNQVFKYVYHVNMFIIHLNIIKYLR